MGEQTQSGAREPDNVGPGSRQGVALPPPPPLPARLVDPRRPVIAGTGLWFLVFCGLLIARLLDNAGSLIWLWTALAGWLLGLVGMAVMYWQRSASRRGTKGAQRGLTSDR